VRRDRREVLQLAIAPREFLTRGAHVVGHRARRADVPEDDHCAGRLPVAVVDRRDGVVDRDLEAVTADEQRISRQVHGLVFTRRRLHRIRDRLAIRGAHELENVGSRRPAPSSHDHPVSFSATRLMYVILPPTSVQNHRVTDAG